MNRTLTVSANLSEQKSGQDADESNRQIEAELVGLLYKQAPSGFIATLINAGIVTFMLWPSVSHSVLLIWLTLIAVITSARYALVLHYRGTASLITQTEYWRTRFIVGAGAAGVAWGTAGIALFSPDSLVAQVLLVFMLGGMAAGGVVSLSPIRAAFFAFFLPTLLPITVRLLFGGEMISMAMSLPLLAFAGVLLEMERRMHVAIVESLRLRFANLTALQKVQVSDARNAATEAARQELEKEVSDRQRVEKQLRYRLIIEDTLGQISRLLASPDAPNFQEIIQLLGETVSVNRAYLFRVRDNGRTMDNTHEWCDDKTAPQIKTLQDVDITFLPWITRALKRGENLIISNVNALPVEASVEKAYLQAQNIFSLLIVPISAQDGTLLGFIGFDDTEQYRTWSDEDLRMLRVVSEMFSTYWTRIQAEEALRQNEARFRSLCASSPVGIFQNDITGACVYTNRRWQEISELTFDESLGSGWINAIIPEDREAVFAEWRNCTQTRQQFSREFQFVRPNGEVGWVHSQATALRTDGGEMLGYVGTAEDITERKRAERRTLQQLSRLSLLHQISNGISARHDLHSILMVVLNRLETEFSVTFACFCLWDQDQNEMVVSAVGPQSRSLAALMKLAEQQAFEVSEHGLGEFLGGTLVYEPDTTRFAVPVLSRFAQTGLRSLIAVPLRVEDHVLGLLFTARHEAEGFDSGDCEFLQQLSDHVALAVRQIQLHVQLQQAYDDLHLTQQTVLQQERLRALGQMASGIAHDINNAISPAVLYVESLLMSEPDLSTNAREELTIVKQALGDITRTVARLREFYRSSEGDMGMVPVDLNAVVRTALELTRARWRDLSQQRGVTISLHPILEKELLAVSGVESELRQALINLIFNAVDAMPDGGLLTICTQATSTAVILKVSDTGVGMDEETRRRCLEPFYTTKGERGTGLGLAMVYGILQRHSARIDIVSTVGQGTTVQLIFPVLPSMGEQDLSNGVEAEVVPPPLKILVVDDDPLVRKSLHDILREDSHDVVIADGGNAGIAMFLAAQEEHAFDVVITDLGMPETDGREVARSVKGASPTTPVVLLTGWGRQMMNAREIPPHVDYLLSKPPTIEELRKTLAFVSTRDKKETTPHRIA